MLALVVQKIDFRLMDFDKNMRNYFFSDGLTFHSCSLESKVESPHRSNDFRPISLVGCMYKLIDKVLANWLQCVIGNVISDSQSTFISGRQILDNILTTNVVVDEVRNSKEELLMFKVDFEKVYDLINWQYLDDIMEKCSFQ